MQVFDLSPNMIIIYALGLIILVLIVWLTRLEMRMKKLTRGKNGADLEDTMEELYGAFEKLVGRVKHVDGSLADVNKRLHRSVQGVSMVRFNPFSGTGQGGNQSFATALLDENGDGIVISTLYSREKVGVYAKEIKKGKSEYELTKEEKQAVDQALVS